MPADPREVVQSAARDLVRSLAALPDPPTARVTAADGRVGCLILVWDVAQAMPTARGESRGRRGGRREGCREDILAVLRAAARPLTRKQVVKALRGAGAGHGPGTVAKALAELTRAGELLNPKDKRGYRLPGWVRKTPGLFDEA
jgi:hypothetical protein